MRPELKALMTSGFKKVMFYKIQHYTPDSYAGWHRSLRNHARPYTYTPWTGTLQLPITISTRKELLDWMFAHVDYGHYIMRGWALVRRKKGTKWKTGTQFKRLAEVTFQPAPLGSDRDYITRNVDIEPITKLRWWGKHRTERNRTDTYLTRTRQRTTEIEEDG